jgi:5-methylcytosine-specific restriction endonuclease McrA
LGRVLLLNATFEPLAVVTARRAVVLVLGEKAETVHHDEVALMRSASLSLPRPSVIRLRRYVAVPFRAQVPLSRHSLLRRDRYACVYCGRRAETIDHVVPRSRGGAHAWDNCVASCRACNHKKGNRLLEEMGWQLSFAPRAPRGLHRYLVLVGEPEPCWMPYLEIEAA